MFTESLVVVRKFSFLLEVNFFTGSKVFTGKINFFHMKINAFFQLSERGKKSILYCFYFLSLSSYTHDDM